MEEKNFRTRKRNYNLQQLMNVEMEKIILYTEEIMQGQVRNLGKHLPKLHKNPNFGHKQYGPVRDVAQVPRAQLRWESVRRSLFKQVGCHTISNAL